MSSDPTCRFAAKPVEANTEILPDPTPPPVPKPPLKPPCDFGDYRLIDQLGRGGMGIVYLAEERALGRQVALKVMNPAMADSAEHRARFQREARAQAAIEHDHVVPIFQVGETNGIPYFAMPVLKGISLAKYLAANPQPPIPEVLRIGRELAEGLSAAHEKGLIHRDVKPGNVWIDVPTGRAKLLDFGLAREADSDVSPAEPVTTLGATVGTAEYMSPEQARGEALDGRTDLFSLGAVLYEMTAGHRPFRGHSRGAVIARLLTDQPDAPHEINSNVPEPLSRFIAKLLAKDPDERPESAALAAAVLERLEAGREALAPPPRKKRTGKWLALAAVAAVIIGGFAIALPMLQKRPDLSQPWPLVQAMLRDFHTIIVIDEEGRPIQLHPGAPQPPLAFTIDSFLEPYPHAIRGLKGKLTPTVPPLMDNLREMHLYGPNVKAADVHWISERLPNCRIVWAGGEIGPRRGD